MTDFLTKLSGQVTGAMIIGTLFPVLLFVLVLVLIVLPITPYGHQQYVDLVNNPESWKGIYAVWATLIILLMTVVLYQVNNPLIRLYEGYPWKESWIGRLLTWRQKKRFERATILRDRIFGVRQAARLENAIGLDESLNNTRGDLAFELLNEFPHAEEFVLPTRLGNIIRAFETYTKRQYNADAIVLWPRLQALLDANYAQALDAVQSAFSFMLNLSFLSTVLALLLAWAGMRWRYPGYFGWLQGWVMWVALFLIVSWFAYEGAINRAREWGLSVKTAFDLYRLPLLQKLGYEIKPSDLTEEKQFWEIINYQLSFPGDGLCRDLPYRLPQLWLMTDPPWVQLSANRTVTFLDDSITQIVIVISNLDPTRVEVSQAFIKDEIPAGFAYVCDTALVNGAPATVEAMSPLQLRLGPLAYKEVRRVVYRLRVQPKS